MNARTDVYALGCVLVHTLTGRPPFSGRGAREAKIAHLTQPPPRLTDQVPGLPAGLDAVVARAMAKRPEDRFASAGEFATALRAARVDLVVVSHPDDAGAASSLVARLSDQGLEVRRARPETGDDLEAARACLVLVGRRGLGEWSRAPLSAAREILSVDRDFVLASALLPGAPDPLEPQLSFLVSRPSVDLRRDLEDPHAVSDILRILGTAPSVLGRAPVSDVGECPYRGLSPFEEDDAPLFFGREREAALLVEKLRDARFLAVLGASGSGKSSLVRAGLVPALRRGAVPWVVATMTPGASPTSALAAQLEQAHGMASAAPDAFFDDPRALDRLAAGLTTPHGEPTQLLLVVDQFEEVFSPEVAPRERRALIDNLVYAATIPGGRTTVVIAMRSDFYARCAEHPELRALVAERQFLVGPLGRADLRRVIEGPAAVAGLTLERGLVRRILADVVGQPGALPLLEYLLLELWQRRRGSFLTLEAYEAAGGVGGALANRANEVYRGLDAGQRDVARRVLLRLTQPGEGTDDTRRRAEIAELSVTADDGPAVAHVVESLSGARLLTLTADEATGAPAVEIAHEALIREWPELRGWIEEDREQLRLHRRLTEATDEWLRSDRDEALLYRGSRLAAWQDRGTQDLNARESEFLAESRGLVERERVSRRRRLRVAFGALTVGIVALAALSAVALVARDQSRNDAAAAKEEAARSLAAQSQLALGTSGDGFTLAQRSIAESPTAEGDEALRQAAQKPLRRSIATGHSRLWAIAPLPDGRVVSGSEDGQLQIWNLSRPETPDSSVATGHPSIYVLTLLPDGRLLSGTDDGELQLWDLQHPSAPVASVATKHDSLYGAAVLSDGRIATASEGGQLEVRDPARLGEAIVSIPTGHAAIGAIIALPGGRVATGSEDGQLQIWDPARPRPRVASVSSAHGGINKMIVLPGGRLLAGTGDGYVDIWRLGPSPRVVASTRVGRGPVWGVQLLPDGRVALANDDGRLEIRDPDRLADPPESVATSHGPLLSVDLTKDGSIMTGSDGAQLEIWDPARVGGQMVSGSTGHLTVNSIAQLPSGRVAVGSDTGEVGIWELGDRARRVGQMIVGHGRVNDLTILSDGRIVTVSEDGGLRLWDPATPARPLASVDAGKAEKFSIANLPDGRVATVDLKGTLEVWDPAHLARPDAVIRTGHGKLWTVTVLTDGRIATGSDDGRLGIWDPATPGAPGVTITTGHGTVFGVAPMPDGRVATGSNDGEVAVWDPAHPARPVAAIATGHGTVIPLAALSGGRIATGSNDGSIQIWDLRHPDQPTATIVSPHGTVSALAVLPGGRIATGSGDGRLEVREPNAFETLTQARRASAAWSLG